VQDSVVFIFGETTTSNKVHSVTKPSACFISKHTTFPPMPSPVTVNPFVTSVQKKNSVSVSRTSRSRFSSSGKQEKAVTQKKLVRRSNTAFPPMSTAAPTNPFSTKSVSTSATNSNAVSASLPTVVDATAFGSTPMPGKSFRPYVGNHFSLSQFLLESLFG